MEEKFLPPFTNYTYIMTEEFNKIIKGEFCPYCNCETKMVLGEIIYPEKFIEIPRPKYLDKIFYQCTKDPNHYIGTYADNKTSLGRLADTELRRWKNKGHNIFDTLWKEKIAFHKQQQAYDWLAKKMEIPLEYTHFGMFSIEQCKQAIGFCEELKKKNEI